MAFPIYRGRFAPTPSGALHEGSLLIALDGWLRARRAGGEWLLRFDDLDRARCPAGADSTIQRQLEAHGLHWDGVAVYQSQHVAEYSHALQCLLREGRLYPCRCTRAELSRIQLPGPEGPVYPGRCREGLPIAPGSETAFALRFRLSAEAMHFCDQVLGPVHRKAEQLGDFLVRRADGQIAYQLASAVDETRMGISEVVRGADLLGSSFWQQALMRALDAPCPAYLHLPLLLDADGRKLSKQNGAPAARIETAPENLSAALIRLGFSLPVSLQGAPVAQQLQFGLECNLPRLKSALPLS